MHVTISFVSCLLVHLVKASLISGVYIYKLQVLQLESFHLCWQHSYIVTSLRNRLDAGKVENLFIFKLIVNLLKAIGKLFFFCTRHLLHDTLCCLKYFFNWNFYWYWFGIGISYFWTINKYNPSFWYGISIQYNMYCSSVPGVDVLSCEQLEQKCSDGIFSFL